MPIRSPVVDEIEVFEAVALELLVVVAFLAYAGSCCILGILRGSCCILGREHS